MVTIETLISAGLPVTSFFKDENNVQQATFSRSLTKEEWDLYLQLTDMAAYRKNKSKNNAKLDIEWTHRGQVYISASYPKVSLCVY